MNDAAVKAFVALIPVCALFTGATIIFVRRRSMSSFLQLVGAAGLVAVVLIHVFEGLHVFPRMGWGSQHSVGHYLDLRESPGDQFAGGKLRPRPLSQLPSPTIHAIAVL